MRQSLVLAACSSCIALGAIAWLARHDSPVGPREAALGDAQLVQTAYARWKSAFEAGPRVVTIALGHSKALSRERASESGEARFDLDTGRVRVELRDVCEDLDVWLVANADGEGRSVAPEAGDRIEWIGSLRASGGAARFDADLAESARDGLRADLVVVTRAGLDPTRNARLVGQPGLFERLWSAERASRHGARSGLLLAAPTAFGAQVGARGRTLVDLVAQGEALFFEETFLGNGRTCATCHPAENNFTLDREFITTLPPDDPLFVAEFVPELMQNQTTGERFETPELMHQFGLITINPDGFEDLANKFVLRSVSHTFSQALTITRPLAGPSSPRDRTGWAGDGAPGAGTLRDFATGAVVQHFPRRMGRIVGEDFRLPTDDELDAIEAFMLAIGRQFEMSVNTMQFISADVANGQTTFAFCQSCHFSAGANSSITQVDNAIVPVGNQSGQANGNFDTGVERFVQTHPDATGIARPIDGGFGLAPSLSGGFGDGTFNTQSLVEFADTAPAFHNHATAHGPLGTDQVEAAVRFYTSSEFGSSTSGQIIFGGPLALGDSQIKEIALFLRAINALENARSAGYDVVRAATATPGDETAPSADPLVTRRLTVARANAEDGRQVLAAVGLHPDAIQLFEGAIAALDSALDEALPWPERLTHIRSAAARLRNVRSKILLNP